MFRKTNSVVCDRPSDSEFCFAHACGLVATATAKVAPMLALVSALFVAAAQPASAQTETVLHTFKGGGSSHGSLPPWMPDFGNPHRSSLSLLYANAGSPAMKCCSSATN